MKGIRHNLVTQVQQHLTFCPNAQLNHTCHHYLALNSTLFVHVMIDKR